MKKTKYLLCDGDSWTAGDIVDPKLFGNDLSKVNDVRNRDYRLPKVWPHKLGKLLKRETINSSVSGSSNDGIVRRTIGNVLYLINKKNVKPEDIFVIIGWSSPERKDFYYKGEFDSMETFYPHELNKKYGSSELDEFHKLYISYFWNPEEYLIRYIHHNLFLHSFLSSYGIPHKFFNSFYEIENNGIFHQFNLVEELKKHFLFFNEKTIDDNQLYEYKIILDEFNSLFEKTFFSKTFQNYIYLNYTNNSNNLKKYFDNYHPTELSHSIWASYLYDNIKNAH